jgi:hypothetical protein
MTALIIACGVCCFPFVYLQVCCCFAGWASRNNHKWLWRGDCVACIMLRLKIECEVSRMMFPTSAQKGSHQQARQSGEHPVPAVACR